MTSICVTEQGPWIIRVSDLADEADHTYVCDARRPHPEQHPRDWEWGCTVLLEEATTFTSLDDAETVLDEVRRWFSQHPHQRDNRPEILLV